MAQKNHTTNLTELLLQCVAQPDPMLSMLEWLCSQLMEAEVSQQLGWRFLQLSDIAWKNDPARLVQIAGYPLDNRPSAVQFIEIFSNYIQRNYLEERILT